MTKKFIIYKNISTLKNILKLTLTDIRIIMTLGK